MQTLPIKRIKIGARRREQLGDIAGLAASIRQYGLLHPIVVDTKDNLVAGGRRLLACEHLNWDKVPVCRLGQLTPLERREIELEENLRRKDLTPAERSKMVVEYVEAAEKAAKEEAKNNARNPRVNQGRGRPAKPGSSRDVERRTGMKGGTVREAKRHVDAFTRYPFLQRPHWNQSSALKAFKALEQLPDKDRARAAAMVDQPALPPDSGITMLLTLGSMPPTDRAAVFADFESGDDKRRSAATCCAAQLPPMPDPRILENSDILARIKKAERFGKAPEYQTARDAIEALQLKLRKDYDREKETLARRNGTC